jgi:predicted type IV restriction endonuclease
MLGITKASAGLVKARPSELPTLTRSNKNKVFEFTSEDVRSAKSVDDLQKICNRCQEAGVTWEGVYDGDVCVGVSKHEKDSADKESCLLSI